MKYSPEDYEKLTEHTGILHGNCNVGIIEGESGLILVECGNLAEHAQAILDSCKALFPGKAVNAVLITHAHTDHCGGLPWILDNSPCPVEVYASQETAAFMLIPQAISTIYTGGTAAPEMATREFLLEHPVKTGHIVTEDKTFDFGTTCVRGIALPGHFEGMYGFVVTEKDSGKKVMFLGDGFFGISMLRKIWIPFIMNQVEFRKSIAKILGEKCQFYIPGHGEVFTEANIDSAAEHNIMITYQFETFICKSIARGFNTEEKLLVELGKWADIRLKPVNYYLIGTTLRSYMVCMELEGKIGKEIENNKLIWRLLK